MYCSNMPYDVKVKDRLHSSEGSGTSIQRNLSALCETFDSFERFFPPYFRAPDNMFMAL